MNVLVMKCDCCNADVTFEPEQWTAVCRFCRKKQVRPRSDGETLRDLERANELWADCRFDEAEARYQGVLARNPDEYEARWKLMLCKYGAQYVTDAATGAQYIVCHVARQSSLRNEAEYRHACELAPEAVRARYAEDAAFIDETQAEIRRLKDEEERPWEVFICYQQADNYGTATPEAQVAEAIHRRISDLGYQAFCAGQHQAAGGSNYEAAVSRALETAKIMIVIGVSREHFEKTAVKSQWTRFLGRVAQQEDRLLLPLYQGDPAGMPEEFRNLGIKGIDLEADYLAKVETCLHTRLRKAQLDKEKIHAMEEEIKQLRAELARQEDMERMLDRLAERIPQQRDDSLDRGIRLYREERYEEALGPLMQAAAAGHAEAQLRLGMMYRRGRVVAKNLAKAAEWFGKAAAQGSAEAQYRLGQLYRAGRGMERDLQQARTLFAMAAEQGLPAAQYELGRLCQAAKAHGEALDWYRRAAAQGYPEAQFKLGVMYAKGNGVERDRAQAFEWYMKAAEQGLPEAQFNLGQMYRTGAGVEKDDDEAFRWLIKAARQGLPQAQNSVGVRYQTGEGVEWDGEEARRWFMRAAGLGEPNAQYNLASMLEDEDPAQAAGWYAKAAEQGHAKAQYALGMMFASGVGVAQDMAQASSWLGKAAAQGHEDAQRKLQAMGLPG